MNKIVIKIISLSFLFFFIQLSSIAQKKVDYGRNLVLDKDVSTSSNSSITASDINHRPENNVSNSLYGLIPGLQVLQNAGNVWDNGATLFIRGIGTLNNKKPLILIDGFERDISEITPDEIETISVLKDAVSLSLYGGRGANGVLSITTKRGKISAPQISFSYRFNIGKPINLPEFVDGYTYANALNEALLNDGLSPRYSGEDLESFRNQTKPELFPNVDWQKECLRNHSYGDNFLFSIRGGNSITKYYAQVNYLDDRGILKPVSKHEGYSTQFKYSKLNIRTNLDIKLTSKTLLQIDLLGNFSEHNRPGTMTKDIFKSLYQVPSGAFPIKHANGIWGGTSVYNNNPVALIADSGYSRSQGRTLYAGLSLKQDLSAITEGLSTTLRLSLDNSAAYWDSNTKEFAYEMISGTTPDGKPKYKKLRDESELSFGTKLGSVYRHSNLNLSLDYKKDIGEHNFVGSLIYSMDKESSKGLNKTFTYMDIVGFGHYSYKKRYLLDIAASASASSVLDPKNRWGFFPSISASWVLSEEKFMKTSWLDLFKLSCSYGISGRADYDYDLYKIKYGAGGTYFFKTPPAVFHGTKEKQLPVEGLTYEKSNNLNIGIDLQFLGSLSFSANGFYNLRTDILVNDNRVSEVIGIKAPKINNGIVANYGVDLTARWNGKTENFRYNLGGNFMFARNKIIQMNEKYRPYNYLKQTGGSIGQLFGYEVIGIYKNESQILSRSVKQMLSDVHPGDYIYKDQNGDNIIDEYDKIPLGYNNICPELYYSFDFSAEYKGLGMYIMFQGAANYSVILNTESVFRPLVGNSTISKYYYASRWSASNPDGIYPRLTTKGSPNNYVNNSVWVRNASFLKLRTLELYYKLPKQCFSHISSIKIFARGNDLLSFNNIPVFDPEGIGETHPLMKVYNFGFNLTF